MDKKNDGLNSIYFAINRIEHVQTIASSIKTTPHQTILNQLFTEKADGFSIFSIDLLALNLYNGKFQFRVISLRHLLGSQNKQFGGYQ